MQKQDIYYNELQADMEKMWSGGFSPKAAD